MKNYILSILILSMLIGCNQNIDDQQSVKTPVKTIKFNDEFAEYWYSGKAEISSYALNQARYGEMRKGNAVLIFVTEPFSKSKQVKLDDSNEAGDDKATVMKLNFVKKFNTGIYPYSMMLSSFTPVIQNKIPSSLKVTMTGQEWCGHIFSQLNLIDDEKYKVQSFSYFESEGDQSFEMDNALLEDEVWNIIRLNYELLPIGEIKIIPGLFAARLKHDNLKPLKAKASIQTKKNEATYTIKYENGRSFAITFNNSFPFKILSWEESYKGLDGQKLTTTAKLKKSLNIDYWNKNSNKDSYLRDSLGLE